MKTMGIKLWGLLMLALVAVSQTFAQTVYKADPTKSKLIIEGTSSLHDWKWKPVILIAWLSLNWTVIK